MTNFDYLKKEKDFDSFVDIAIVAEKTYKIDVSTCIINCRRALEAGIKWMYSVDADLDVPYQDNLHTLMNTRAFKSIMDDDIWKRIEFIRRYGNEAVHTSTTKTASIAKICLRNLFYFTDFIAYCYGDNYEEREFDESLLEQEEVAPVKVVPDVDLEALIAENKSLKEELSSRRVQQQETYVSKPLDLSEFKTRKLYIDAMLMDAGWIEGKDWINEVELDGMPNKSEVGYADYVLYDDMNIPLAVIEAKRSCKDPAVGRQQAKLYADLLEKKYKRRPVIFITNGFETRIIDNDYPERRVSSIYSKRDLEKYFNLRRTKSHLNYIAINQNLKMVKNLSKIQNIALILDGVNLVSTWATFAILYEKLNSMEEEIVGAIEKVQQSLNKGMQLHVKAEYNKVISDYQDMLDCRKKQKPYSEEQMRKLVDSLYVVLDMMIDSLKSDLIDNKDNMILTVFMMLSMYTASLRFFDEQYYFNYKDILSGDEVWHTSHNKWMSLYDTLTQSWFVELLQDHGIFDLDLNTDEMDTYYNEFLEQVQDQKQEVIDNQEIILTLQDTSLLNVFHEKTNEEIHNELEKEISEMFNGIEGEDASKLYDSLHNQIQYA